MEPSSTQSEMSETAAPEPRIGIVKFAAHNDGGRVVPLEGETGRSVYLSPRATRGLLDGDVVAVTTEPRKSGTGRPVLRVTRQSRRRRIVVGVIKDTDQGRVLEADPAVAKSWVRLRGHLRVRPGSAVALEVRGGGRSIVGARVVAGPWAPGSLEHLRAVALVRSIGAPATGDVRLAEVAHRRLRVALAGEVPVLDIPRPVAVAGRVDYRGDAVVTIDGAETADIDDAVWAEETAEGWTVRVHIADVASAVPVGSELDEWARAAATSVYMFGQVTHMLPPELAADACSLVAGVDRDVLTAQFHVGRDGSVGHVEVGAGRIKVTERLTYDDVDAWLEGATGAVGEQVAGVVGAAAAAAGALGVARDRREALGGLMQPPVAEPAVRDGRVTLERSPGRTEAHRLIEELMIAANEAVGVWLHERSAPALYRAQPGPSAGLVEEISAVVALWGGAPSEAGDEELDAIGVAALLDAIDDDEAREAAAVRVRLGMQRAGYIPEPGSHFQLGATHYLHFTSPIRRYADLVVHRTVHAVLAGGAAPHSPAELAELAAWVTDRSQSAKRAETTMGRMLWASLIQAKLATNATVSARSVVCSLSSGGALVRIDRWGLMGMVGREHFGGVWSVEDAGMSASYTGGTLRVGDPLPVRFTKATPAVGEFTIEPAFPGAGSAPAEGAPADAAGAA